MFWGYSLAYGRNGGPFIGDLHNFGMINVMAAPAITSDTIPEIVFCLYQMFFCACVSLSLTNNLRGCFGPISEGLEPASRGLRLWFFFVGSRHRLT